MAPIINSIGRSSWGDGMAAAQQQKEIEARDAAGQRALTASGYGYDELTPELQRQYNSLLQSGMSEDDIASFGATAGSAMAQQAQLAPYQQAGQQQLDNMQNYAQAGQNALTQQQALLGLSGQDAMNKAYNENPAQAFARQQQEQALLRNSAATGGLRGSGVQRELAELTSGLTNQNIQNQLSQLGVLSGRGQQATTGMYNQGYDASQGMANIYGTGHADLAGMQAGYAQQRASANAGQTGGGGGYGQAIGSAYGSQYGPIGSAIGGAAGSVLDDLF